MTMFQKFIPKSHFFKRIKELSDSSSGGVFGEWDYNEGLKFGDFKYCMCRSKCFGPNETNFMNF